MKTLVSLGIFIGIISSIFSPKMIETKSFNEQREYNFEHPIYKGEKVEFINPVYHGEKVQFELL